MNECMQACIMLDYFNDKSLSMVTVCDQHLVLPWTCTLHTQTNALYIILDCLDDEFLVIGNVSDQYLVLPWTCTIDIQMAAEC